MQLRSRLFSRREVFTPTDGVSDVSYPVNPTFTFAKALHCAALVISNAINLLTKELKHPHFIKANIRPNRQWLFLVGLVIAITTGVSQKAVAQGCANTVQYPAPFESPIKGAGPYTITNVQYQEEYNQMTVPFSGSTFRSTAGNAGTWITVRAGTVTGALVAQGSTPLNWTASAGGTYFIHYNTNSACGTARTNMATTVENTTPVCANTVGAL